MGKVFLVIGKSFSGKDTFINQVLSDREFCEKNNLHRLIRYTTRKPRKGEVHGVDYYFQNDFVYNPETCVMESYDTEYGKLIYMTDFDDIESDKNYILTADPEYLDEYKRILDDRLCLIYLITPNWVLLKRFANRNENEEYSDNKWQEICRRFFDDNNKFNEYSKEYLKDCYSIINLGEKLCVDGIKTLMDHFINDTMYFSKTDSIIILNDEIKFLDHSRMISFNDDAITIKALFR